MAIKKRPRAVTLPSFPIVAIGASAGGLDAFESLLRAVPPRTGMAFVVIQHLSPTHASMLSEILGRATEMAVTQVDKKARVEPNHVYVIPPNGNLVYANGALEVVPRAERGAQRPIDHFMRSLAEAHGHLAIGVVLSGTASDGALGVQEIKAVGGITFAQDATAEQLGMPRSAVATGAVDFVIPADEIGRELGRLARHPYVTPRVDATHAPDEKVLERILGMLRHASGVDFDGYKRNTLYRRIARRLLVHKLDDLDDYVRFIRANPSELDALFQDVLINVTSFFRNPDAFEALKTHVFPQLTDGRSRHEQVRMWVLGCATGEEAYSLAMAFTEYLEKSGRTVDAQIFATDLNGAGIDRARTAIYSKGIAQDVSPERLRSFFVEVDGAYRISKRIRDMCVFARQNALSDPPFSRLDLVTCRNMLIYLEQNEQRRLIPMLHYALRNHGFLWLGGSETIGTYRELFDIVDVKNKIYARRPVPSKAHLAVSGFRWEPTAPRDTTTALLEPQVPDTQREADRLLLGRYSPPAVVVTDDLDILHFRGDTGPFLVPPSGRATHSLLKMLREGLLVGVRGAIGRARKTRAPVRAGELRVSDGAGWRNVDVEVFPLTSKARNGAAFVLVFEEPTKHIAARTRQIHDEAVVAQSHAARNRAKGSNREEARLKQELAATREYLQSVIEQQEAANEELQSANEEVQSANEELQSINEELETSKEEIQSANEELATINDELQNRNLELSQTNNDLTNLLASVQLAIVMLGPDLRIRRFTPAAEKLFNLIPGDVGRALTDIKLDIIEGDLEALLLEVIENVTTHEREIRDREGRWYSMRIRPYRTLENRIDGVVIVVVDINEQKGAKQALRESEARFEILADSAPVLIWMSDVDGCKFVNRAFEEFVGEGEPQIRGTNLTSFMHKDDRESFDHAFRDATRKRHSFEIRTRFRRADGEYRWTKTVGMPRFSADGELAGFVGGTFDITDMKEAEAALIELDRGKNEFLATLAHELRNPLAGVRNASRLLGESNDHAIIERAHKIIDRQTSHMVRLIDDLLEISRMTQGKIRMRFEQVDLCVVLRQSIDATAGERAAEDQSVTASLPPTGIHVLADSMRLEQIFVNLLQNASKFTPRGGHVWVTLEIEASDEGAPVAVIRIRDDGMGIDASNLPRIFDLFQQAEPAGRGRGLGLGLTLAKRLVELHEGKIEAFSAGEGRGTEMVVRLPLREARTTERNKSSDGTDSTEASMRVGEASAKKNKRVLIVDDNADSTECLQLLLQSAGHQVDAVYDGESTFDRASTFHPDVVLVDIGLPGMSGYDVAAELRVRKDTRDVVAIAMTGFGSSADIRRSLDAGFDAHMTKPVDVDVLLERISGLQHTIRPA
jgi:two-component system CheB/CheR fusion protein